MLKTLVVLFLLAIAAGFLGITVKPKGRSVFEDIKVWIYSLFNRTPSQDDDLDYGDVYFDDDVDIESIKVSGAIVPINGYITWYVDPIKPSRTISAGDVDRLIKQSFGVLENFTGKVRFKQVLDKKDAQIIIGFWRNGQTGLKVQFQSTTLAYAYLANNTDSLGITSDVFFNDVFHWHPTHTEKGKISFHKVFFHEVLHAMGLHHSDNPSDILYPRYNPLTGISISSDTANGIKDLYKGFPGPDEAVDDGDDDSYDPCADCDCPETPCPVIDEKLKKDILAFLSVMQSRTQNIENFIKDIQTLIK